eukprot:1363748-Pyramimonas_sp.AAC.1
MQRAADRRRTVWLGKLPGKLFGFHMYSRGHPRLGLGVVLQCHTGLRPSELLGVCQGDVVFASDVGGGEGGAEVRIALCLKIGTKSRRPQVARLWKADEDIVELLRVARKCTPPGLQLFPYSLATYRTILKQIVG